MVKVAVLGAAGGIGQPLSLLIKQSPKVSDLALFDVAPVVVGVATDLSHINTPSTTSGYTKEDDGLKKAVTGADIVIIPAGVPRKPGMTRDDLFKVNAGIVRDLVEEIGRSAPEAYILIISNPVNSTVPVAVETLKKAGVFNPKKVFGVTTLDVVRSATFLAQSLSKPTDADKFTVPVIGGHSGKTILPLLSQSKPAAPGSLFDDETKYKELVNRIQFGGDEVVKAKAGAGSATLSMAYAGFRFADKLISALQGETGIVEPAYVYVKQDPEIEKTVKEATGLDLDYFSLPIQLGKDGVEKINPIGPLNAYEKQLLHELGSELEGSIQSGFNFTKL